MSIFIATDITIFRKDNSFYTREKVSNILKRYYDAFGKIVLFSRVNILDDITDDLVDITNLLTRVVPAKSLLSTLIGGADKAIIDNMKDCSLIIGRCPSINAYWNHGIIGKIIAPFMFFKMKQVVRKADYALYVTSEFLQKRYPRKKSSVAVSNVLIDGSEENVLNNRIDHIKSMDKSLISLMTTAATNVRYKGQQYVIKAIPKLNKLGIKIKYYVVGEGDIEYLHSLAKKLKVENQVVFTGRCSLKQVFELLDRVDIYIQPSLQEGLPRSVIEAMSRGCIAIGAKTAGIPELLEDEDVFRRKSSNDIVRVVYRISNNSTMRNIEKAKRNFDVSKLYYSVILDKKRTDYYSKIKSELHMKCEDSK